MPDMPTTPEAAGDYDLDTSYEMKGPQDAAALYGRWASTYDESFGAGWGYIAPQRIAGLFLHHATAEDAPVLDVGGGTGLVAAALDARETDAVDISREMLEEAGRKGLYRQRIVADLTQALPIPDATYGGFVSSGTFTHGHVGAGCLPELLRVARPGALFCMGTRTGPYDEMGFGSALAELVAARRITPVDFADIPVYEGADHPHKDDRGLVMIFRKR